MCGNQSSRSSLVTRSALESPPARPGMRQMSQPPDRIGVEVDPLAVRRVLGAVVVVARRGELLLGAAAHWHAKQVERLAVALADERQPLVVRRPSMEIARRGGRQQLRRSAVRARDEHLRPAAACHRGGEAEQLAVPRPSLIVVAAILVSDAEALRLTAVRRKAIELRARVHEQPLAVRRPVRRLPNLVRRKDDAARLRRHVVNRDLAAILGLLSSSLGEGPGYGQEKSKWKFHFPSYRSAIGAATNRRSPYPFAPCGRLSSVSIFSIRRGSSIGLVS